MSTFTELFPNQIYMNLDRRTDRRELAEKEFERMGISPVRMPGVFITTAPNQRLNDILGCMYAHIECLIWGFQRESNVFIYEDDIKFIDRPDIRELTDAACSELEQREWDMFYLCANILRPHRQESEHLSRLNHAQSTVAYGVNFNFIPKLLSYLPLNGQITQPWIDVIYAENVVPQNKCYISVPMMGVQREGWSDIEGMHVRYEDYLLQRYNQHFIPTRTK